MGPSTIHGSPKRGVGILNNELYVGPPRLEPPQELAIVLRGDLAAILRFAANKKNPDVLSEVGVLGALLSQESLVAGTRNTRSRRNGGQNANGAPSGAPSLVSQESLVAGARNTRFLRLVERAIPRLAA